MKTTADWARPRRLRRDRTAGLLYATLLGTLGAVTGAFLGILFVEVAAALDFPLYDLSVPDNGMGAWLPFASIGALLGLLPGALLGWRMG